MTAGDMTVGDPAPITRTRPRRLGIDGPMASSWHPQSVTTIGRSSDCDITIRDGGISRRHAIVRQTADGSWTVSDCDSRNGTRVGDQRVHEPVILRDGSVIVISGYEIVFRDTDRIAVDQATLEIDHEVSIDRRGPSDDVGGHWDAGIDRAILELTFAIAPLRSLLDVAGEVTRLLARCSSAVGGGMFWITESGPRLIAALPSATDVPQISTGTMRRIADGESYLLIRGGDGQADPGGNSLSRLGLGSAIVAPVQCSDSGDGRRDGDERNGRIDDGVDSGASSEPSVRGVLLLSSAADDPPLGPDDLDIAVAVARVLGLWAVRYADDERRRRSIADNAAHLRWITDAAPADRPLWLASAAMADVADHLIAAITAGETVVLTGPRGVGRHRLAEIAAAKYRALHGSSEGRVSVDEGGPIDETQRRSTRSDAAADVVVSVPPLAGRTADIVAITRGVTRNVAEKRGIKTPLFSRSALGRLTRHGWPGNVPQLIDAVRTTVHAAAPGATIEISDLAMPPDTQGDDSSNDSGVDSASNSLPHAAGIERTLHEVEMEHLRGVLNHTDGNKSLAAQILGIDRSTLDRKLRRAARAKQVKKKPTVDASKGDQTDSGASG